MTNPRIDVQLMSARDGVSIAYRATDLGTGLPTLALVHSLALDHRFWDPVAERLAGKAAVVAIDARGHGQSGLGRAAVTTAGMADDLRDVLDRLKLDRVVVGGASMGGCVALQFAGSHPARTRGLALIDTTAWYGPMAPQDWEGRANKAERQGLQSLVEFQLTRWFSDAFRAQSPERVQRTVECFLANRIDGYAAACRMLGAFDGRPLMADVRVPTLVVVGDEDYAAPVAMAEALHQGIAGSHLQILRGARHLTPLETPDVIAASLLQLCSKASQ